jgi:hypothetical protein
MLLGTVFLQFCEGVPLELPLFSQNPSFQTSCPSFLLEKWGNSKIPSLDGGRERVYNEELSLFVTG